MSAYIVALIEYVGGGDHWANTEYGPTFRRLLDTYGGAMVAAAPFEQVEGLALDETTAGIFEFPSVAAAHSFWNDPDYRAVVPLRQPVGRFQIFIIPGVDEAPWSPPPNRT